MYVRVCTNTRTHSLLTWYMIAEPGNFHDFLAAHAYQDEYVPRTELGQLARVPKEPEPKKEVVETPAGGPASPDEWITCASCASPVKTTWAR